MREARRARTYRCCGWRTPTLACAAEFPLRPEDGPDENRARARAAGWFVWTPGDGRGGRVLCPEHTEAADAPPYLGSGGIAPPMVR